MKIEWTISSSEQMVQLGTRIAQLLPPQGIIIFLCGPLGAGKTTWVRGFLRGLDYKGNVKSPTYTLVESYDFESIPVHHFDFYRLNDPLEIEFLGIEDYFENTYCLIEWPEKAQGELPSPHLSIHIEIDNNTRTLILEAFCPDTMSMLEKLNNEA